MAHAHLAHDHEHEHRAHKHHADMEPVERDRALGMALRLEYFSLAWNFLETFVGFAAGLAAGSVALIGFALDSVVESSSAGALIWRLRAERHGRATTEDVERRAVRIVAVAFFALAAYVGVQAVIDLVTRSQPESSPLGIALAAVSVAVMPWLAWRKRKMSAVLDSRSLMADSDQTSLCTYISVALLVGLGANAAFGWWWADPVAGLVIAALAAREGRELWTTEHFCVC
jgi:divalent metal cation (Fe/Co/Zn/Cd) transporter